MRPHHRAGRGSDGGGGCLQVQSPAIVRGRIPRRRFASDRHFFGGRLRAAEATVGSPRTAVCFGRALRAVLGTQVVLHFLGDRHVWRTYPQRHRATISSPRLVLADGRTHVFCLPCDVTRWEFDADDPPTCPGCRSSCSVRSPSFHMKSLAGNPR